MPAVAGLPVDQHLGNLEGKELRFGTSAGATFAALTVDVTCGAVNCEHDSLNPLAGLSPLVGMWLNCIYGGKGVGMINLLLFLIVGVFVAGQMVGRTPEYLGKKVGAREMKLAMIALLVHPIMILGPTGLFAATDWGMKAENNPGAAWLLGDRVPVLLGVGEQRLGLRRPGSHLWLQRQSQPGADGRAVGHRQRPGDAHSAASPDHRADRDGGEPGRRRRRRSGSGPCATTRSRSASCCFGTIVIIGALLFLPVAALGPLAEHLGSDPVRRLSAIGDRPAS